MISYIEGIIHMCNKCGKASRTSDDLQTHISRTFHLNSLIHSQIKVPTSDLVSQNNKNNENKSISSSNTHTDNNENKGKTESNDSVETKQKRQTN